MPTNAENTRRFFMQVSELAQRRLGPEIRQYLSSDDYLGAYERAPDEACRREMVEVAADAVLQLEDAGLLPIEGPVPLDLADERWALLEELETAYAQATGHELSLPAPVSIAVRKRFDLGRSLVPDSRLVQVTVDERVSLDAAIRAMRKAWPELRRRGLLRRTSRLGERSLAVVRFVCLSTTPEMTWEQRVSAWNHAYGPAWHSDDRRKFQSEFARAERSLTGRRGGLRWFYDATERRLAEEGYLQALGLSDSDPLRLAAERRVQAMLPELVSTINAFAKSVGGEELRRLMLLSGEYSPDEADSRIRQLFGRQELTGNQTPRLEPPPDWEDQQ